MLRAMGGGAACQRRRLRVVAASLAVLHLAGACYTYVPPRTTPVPGAAVRLDLSDQGRVAHAAAIGPGVASLSGTLTRMDGDRLVVDVVSVTPIKGPELPVSGISVRLAASDFGGLEVRTLSRKRTGILIGTAVAIVTTFLVTKGFKAGQTPPEGPPGSGGPDQYRGLGGR